MQPEQWGRFLVEIFDEWVQRDVGTVFVQTFDAALGSWLGVGSSLCIFRETCGDALALEHNGDLYSCDHFVEPEYLLGNILETHVVDLVASPQQRAFGQAKADTLPAYCRSCDVRFACNGECPRNRFTRTPDGEAGLNYLCAGYKEFFHHIDGPMRTMAGLLRAGRYADEIMNARATRLIVSGSGSERPGRPPLPPIAAVPYAMSRSLCSSAIRRPVSVVPATARAQKRAKPHARPPTTSASTTIARASSVDSSGAMRFAIAATHTTNASPERDHARSVRSPASPCTSGSSATGSRAGSSLFTWRRTRRRPRRSWRRSRSPGRARG